MLCDMQKYTVHNIITQIRCSTIGGSDVYLVQRTVALAYKTALHIFALVQQLDHLVKGKKNMPLAAKEEI